MIVPPLRSLLTKAFDNWNRDHGPRLAASLAFYGMLAMAPLLVLGVAIASPILGQSEVRNRILGQAADQMGRPAAEFLQTLIDRTSEPTAGLIASVIAILVALHGATNLFAQLSDSVNFIWGVRHPPGFKSFLLVRLTALFMFLAFAVLLIAWLALDSWLGWLQRARLGSLGWQAVSFLASTAFLSGVFALSFKALPPRAVAWSDVGWSAVITAMGFSASKFLLSLYFAYSGVSAAYGSAGALVVVLLWVYYNAQIYLFGTELTCTYAHSYGSQMKRREGEEPIRSS